MLDVAAVVEAILRRESPQTQAWLAKSFGIPTENTSRWIALITGLHDFGKAIPGFQFKWPEGQRADQDHGLSFKPASLDVHRHDLASAALLRRLLRSKFPEADWILAITQALGAHHGYMPSSTEIRDAMPRNEGPGWADARTELLEAYLLTLGPGEGPTLDEISLSAVAWLAGLTSVADWIGSNVDWFPIGERAHTLTDHYAKAGELAEAALDAIGWPAFQLLLTAAAGTDTLVPCDGNPRAIP